MLEVENVLEDWQHHADGQNDGGNQVEVVGAEPQLEDQQEDEPVENTPQGDRERMPMKWASAIFSFSSASGRDLVWYSMLV